jgi:hypothetical protein
MSLQHDWREMHVWCTCIVTAAGVWGRKHRRSEAFAREDGGGEMGGACGALVAVCVMSASLWSIVHFPSEAEVAMRAAMVLAITSVVALFFQPFVVEEKAVAATNALGLALGCGWLACVHWGLHVNAVNRVVATVLGVVVGGSVHVDSFWTLSFAMFAVCGYDFYWTMYTRTPTASPAAEVVVLRACHDLMVCAVANDAQWRIPNVLLVGRQMLGLGDVVAGGVVTTHALCHYGWLSGVWTVCAYNLGLQLAFSWSLQMDRGVPALVTIIPCTWLVLACCQLRAAAAARAAPTPPGYTPAGAEENQDQREAQTVGSSLSHSHLSAGASTSATEMVEIGAPLVATR